MISLDDSIKSLRNEKIKKIYVFEGDEQVAVIEKSSIFTITATKDLFLSLKADQLPYRGNALPQAFQMNMPEGFLKDFLTAKLSKYFKVDPMLFLAIQGSNPLGKYTFKSDYPLTMQRPDVEALDDLIHNQDEGYFESLLERFYLDSGISGAQPKTMMTSEKGAVFVGDMIVKSFDEIDFKALALNEYLCMSMAREVGLEVPDFYISDDQKRFIIKRFDIENGQNLNMEDMQSASSHKDKYHGSYEEIASLIGKHSSNPSEDKEMLFKSMVLNKLVENGDAHLKNYSFLYSDFNNIRLSPTYDVVSTSVYPDLDKTLALKLNGKVKFPSKAELLKFAEKIGIDKHVACDILKSTTSKVKSFIEHQDLTGVSGLREIIEKNIVTLEADTAQLMGHTFDCNTVKQKLADSNQSDMPRGLGG